MGYVQINDDQEDALPAPNPRPTGRLRWWQPQSGGRELQQQWVNEFGMLVWVAIPTHIELHE